MNHGLIPRRYTIKQLAAELDITTDMLAQFLIEQGYDGLNGWEDDWRLMEDETEAAKQHYEED